MRTASRVPCPGDDPTLSERSSELVREIIYQKHIKESNALARRVGQSTARRTDRNIVPRRKRS